MGYTIGTGKDSRHDAGFTEQEVLARFVARQPEIEAYKRQHGGALEDAFRAVTGEPWPEGRSIKVHGNGRAEFTKDRTVKSVMGKYVAPIAGGVAAPFLLPLLAGGAAAGGAAAAGGGGAAGGAGAAGTLASTTIGSGMLPAIGGTSSTLGAIGGGGGGILGTLGKVGKYGQQASDIGEQLSAGAAGQAEGRRADSTADMYAASQNNRALVDAAQFNRDLPMTRAQQTARGDLMSSPMQNASSTGSGRDIQFSGGVRPSSFGASTTQAGEELKRQALLKMMNPEADQLTPQITQPRQAGAGENALGMAGTGLSILGAYNKYRGGR